MHNHLTMRKIKQHPRKTEKIADVKKNTKQNAQQRNTKKRICQWRDRCAVLACPFKDYGLLNIGAQPHDDCSQ